MMMNPVQGSAVSKKANLSISSVQHQSTFQMQPPSHPPPPQTQRQQPQQQQQSLTQAQLTYAQKVKGQNQGGASIPVMNGGAQTLPRQSSQVRAQGVVSGRSATVPSSSSAIPQPVAAMATKSATPSTNPNGGSVQPPRRPTQTQQQQQQQFRMVPTGSLMTAQAIQNYAYPYNYTSFQSRSAYSNPPYARSAAGANHSNKSGQRDFFDRRVQSNVNHAVNRYYNYPQSNRNNMSASFGGAQNTNRWASNSQRGPPYPVMSYSNGQRRGAPPRNGPPPSFSGRRGGRGGGMGRGGRYPSNRGPPSYSSRGPPFMRNGNVMNGPSPPHSGPNRRVRAREKPTDSQLKNYENAADRDVLCWIYENQGKCRYGQKCQWLHLCRETGQYIPTVYMMNSLDTANDEDSKAEQSKKEDRGKGGDPQKGGDGDGDDEKEDTESLKTKFQVMMEQNIQNRVEEEKKKKKLRAVDQDEEDNKEEMKATESTALNGDRTKSSGKGDESKEEETTNGKKCGKYGSYGTTFDRFNVCWEFNTFVGCRKGSKCKWAHAYLVKESAHPYTGEKLNGMAVRKFRVSNNI